ncbi:MAG: M12 family metallopeptidase, partial [Blastocatellia bacterium]
MRHRKRFQVALSERLRRLWLLVILLSLCWGSVGQAQKLETQDVKTNLTQGAVLMDDIQVPAGFAFSPQFTYTTNLWTDGEVPYVFDANVNEYGQNAMLAAMAEWEKVAGVDFRPAQDYDANYVHIQDSNANNSWVGMKGGMQIINIVSWDDKFIIVHELGHCLGLWHEQSRPDRDAYVEIIFSNIQAGKEGNFAIKNDAYSNGPYDFDSIMHYNKCTFSTGCSAGKTCKCAPGTETILVREPYRAEWQNKIGQRSRLSSLDRNVMATLYPIPVYVDGSYTGSVEKGTATQPFKSFVAGANAVAPDGRVIVRPGSYAAAGSYNKPMTIKAPQG